MKNNIEKSKIVECGRYFATVKDFRDVKLDSGVWKLCVSLKPFDENGKSFKEIYVLCPIRYVDYSLTYNLFNALGVAHGSITNQELNQNYSDVVIGIDVAIHNKYGKCQAIVVDFFKKEETFIYKINNIRKIHNESSTYEDSSIGGNYYA